MAKELPYFKYYPSEWITGDITLCSMEAQGLFINLCVYYWTKNCSMSLANAKQRFSKHEASIKELLNKEIIKLDGEENIIINFLDEQMNGFIKISETRAKSGSKGGKANAKQMLSKNEAKRSNIEKIREDKDNIEARAINFGKSLDQFITDENRNEVYKFYNYWTEPNKSKTKLKFELEKTWDTKKRLVTWMNNSKKFNK